ncbi:U3 snoRNP protein [Cavenderia fasciculata]|uniref:U3 snoRNP protein n=1 Tax=Cavenderia fasciculata TaxID=261658 RepID=F4PK33_CACFS|nr:U3 snoRNP protein [Cavenderia fasciculata]EGG23957.1 U3 snoRNP protein [Cavenderia fasciculata]|eukprot:XP_004361808.1 U3 snoRNP protein [Cavenderia fasciculata]
MSLNIKNLLPNRVKYGVHYKHSGNSASKDQIIDAKTHDRAYLQSKRIAEDKKIERLQSELQYLDSKLKQSETVIFVDGDKEVKKFSAVKYYDTIPEALKSGSSVIPKLSKLREGKLLVNPDSAPKLGAIEAMTTTSYKELNARIERRDGLKKAESDLGKHIRQLANKDQKPLKKSNIKSNKDWKLARKK